MAFIDRKELVVLNIMLTSKGREQLSNGNLTFKYLSLGDSEIDYKFVNDIDYNPTGSTILKPKDKNPKIISFIPRIQTGDTFNEIFTGSTATTLINGTSYNVVKTAPTLGFFNSLGTTFNTSKYHVKQPDLMTYMSGITGGNLLYLKKASTYGSRIEVPAIHDYILVRFAHDNNTTGYNIDINLPTPYLFYRIVGVSGTTENNDLVIQIDRELPDYSLYSPTGIAGVMIYYSGLTYLYEYSTDYLNDDVITFLENYQYPIEIFPYWNMYIIFTEEIAGIQAADRKFGQFNSRTVGGFVSYIQNQAPVYKKLGLIHYTNNSPANVYGEEFYNNTPVLNIPTIMWHKSSTRTLGLTLVATGNVKTLSGMSTNYYDLADNNGNIVGKVFTELKLFVIEDQELLFAMSYKSNRSWTLPNYKFTGFGELTPCPECPECPEPPITTIPQVECDSSTSYGGGLSYPSTQEVLLGEDTGTVILDYNGISVPDRFIVYFEGNVVIDTGYRGNASLYNYGSVDRGIFNYYLNGKADPILNFIYPNIGNPLLAPDGYPWVINGISGINYFQKLTNTSIATIEVYAPVDGTAWEYTISCPTILPTTETPVIPPTLPPIPPVVTTEPPVVTTESPVITTEPSVTTEPLLNCYPMLIEFGSFNNGQDLYITYVDSGNTYVTLPYTSFPDQGGYPAGIELIICSKIEPTFKYGLASPYIDGSQWIDYGNICYECCSVNEDCL